MLLVFDLVVHTALTAVLAFFGTLAVTDGDLSAICNYLSLPPYLTLDFHVPKPVSGIAFVGSAVAFKAYYLDAAVVRPQIIDTTHWSPDDIDLTPHATPSTSEVSGPLPSFSPTPCTVTPKDGALYNFIVTRMLKQDIALVVRNLVALLAKLLYRISEITFTGVPTFVRLAKFMVYFLVSLWERRADISLTLAVGDWAWKLQGVPLLLALLVVQALAGKVLLLLRFSMNTTNFPPQPFVFDFDGPGSPPSLAKHVGEHGACEVHSIKTVTDEVPANALSLLQECHVSTRSTSMSIPTNDCDLDIDDLSLRLDLLVLTDEGMEAKDVEVKDTLSTPLSLNAALNDSRMVPALAPNDDGQIADNLVKYGMISAKSSSVVALDSCQDFVAVNTSLPSDKEPLLDTALFAPLPQVVRELEVTTVGESVKNIIPGSMDAPAEEVKATNSCSNCREKPDWSFLYDEDSHLFHEMEAEMERECASRAQKDSVSDTSKVRRCFRLL
jgi:hypothetical protein